MKGSVGVSTNIEGSKRKQKPRPIDRRPLAVEISALNKLLAFAETLPNAKGICLSLKGCLDLNRKGGLSGAGAISHARRIRAALRPYGYGKRR